uniref:Secreted protein n=1 Tax=Arundo donax TaxID=35708 RepID=A0A0A9ABW9_ARUDO
MHLLPCMLTNCTHFLVIFFFRKWWAAMLASVQLNCSKADDRMLPLYACAAFDFGYFGSDCTCTQT